MLNKRLGTGRLAKVEERRRSNRIRWTVGIIVFVTVAVLIVIAVRHRNAFFKPSGDTEPPDTGLTEDTTPEPPGKETSEPAAPSGFNVLVVNNTRVPQRFGNALAAIEEYNVENDGIFKIETERSKLLYGPGTMIIYRPGYEEYASSLAKVIGGQFPMVQADVSIVCGEDISNLILEAFVKEGRLTEEVRVEVLNGCGIEGAAAKTKERLESNGYTIVAVGNAANFDYEKTLLYVGEGGDGKTKRIAELFGMENSSIIKTDYDVKIVIGDDYSS